MKKIFSILFVLGFLKSQSQIIIVCDNLINGKPLKNTAVTVKSNGKVIQNLNTESKSTFSVELEFGEDYAIYLENERCTPMFFEVLGKTVPKAKFDNTMEHAMDAAFVDKTNPNVNHEVFKQPFSKIIYGGKSKMMDDTAYINQFDKSIRKVVVAQVEPTKKEEVEAPVQEKVIIAGKVFVNTIDRITLNNHVISLVNSSGKILKSTSTNRYGAFHFTRVNPIEVSGLIIEVKQLDAIKGKLSLYNSKGESVSTVKPEGNSCNWNLNTKEVETLIDNGYTTNIGGKLVSSSPKMKKFFANKNVYLSDKSNLTIKKTKTNKLGSFVFEDVEPDNHYYIGVDKTEILPGEKIDLLSKEDSYIATLDTTTSDKVSLSVNSNYNKVFNEVSIGDEEMKMDVKATIFGDNVNHPIGKLKILLLNDNYKVIDSAVTDNLGTFKFKYLPFLKRFYLSAENQGDVLDEFKNILIYSGEDNLIKIMTHQKGAKFLYKAVSAELSSLRDVELEDPWLEFIEKKPTKAQRVVSAPAKSIIENILFETNKYEITESAKEILDKIILVLNTNKQLKIGIEAHTDSKGSNEANMSLSEMRAKTVSNYITNAGIEAKRVKAKGFGETKLLNQCSDGKECSEAEHAKNRRIEFKISEE